MKGTYVRPVERLTPARNADTTGALLDYPTFSVKDGNGIPRTASKVRCTNLPSYMRQWLASSAKFFCRVTRWAYHHDLNVRENLTPCLRFGNELSRLVFFEGIFVLADGSKMFCLVGVESVADWGAESSRSNTSHSKFLRSLPA